MKLVTEWETAPRSDVTKSTFQHDYREYSVTSGCCFDYMGSPSVL